MEYAEGRLITRKDGPIGWLAFNQPERLNAVRLDMWLALPEAVVELDADPEVRAIVVAGAGDRAFISGADIAEFDRERFDAASNAPFTEAVAAATGALVKATKPVIAMIKGFCIGGGMVIASACDFRICAEGSRFGVPAGRLGLGYELDNYKRLHTIVGPGIAMEMLATARQFSDVEALQARFVNRIVPVATLEAATRELVAMIAHNAPLSVVAAKLANRAAAEPALKATAQKAIDACFDSADYKEGRAAFHAKREPKFTGR
jgi:enoyl-CoA hydratase/carnithine racemase